MKFYDCLLRVRDFHLNRGNLTALFYFYGVYNLIFNYWNE